MKRPVTDDEIRRAAEALDLPVAMVDTRPMTPSVETRVRAYQSQLWSEWLTPRLPGVRAGRPGWVVWDYGRVHVDDLRDALLADGEGGPVRLMTARVQH